MNALTQTYKLTQFIAQPFSERSLGATLKAALSDQISSFHTFRAAVAFVKRSGVQHIQIELQQFVQSGGLAQIVVGIDQLGSSLEGLTGLLNAVGEQGSVWVNRTTETYVTFHPKVYLFVADRIALVIVGSGNLTEGGLYTNDEASLMYWLDLEKPDDQVLLQEINTYLDKWGDVDDGNAVLLTADLLNELVEMGLVPTEEKIAREVDEATTLTPTPFSQPVMPPTQVFFKKSAVKRTAPRFKISVPKPKKTILPSKTPVPQLIEPAIESPTGFVMILQRTDVGKGQTTSGTSRRSPEIFIPLAARDAFPEFWGWPMLFTEDATHSGKYDRQEVKMRIGGELVNVNM